MAAKVWVRFFPSAGIVIVNCNHFREKHTPVVIRTLLHSCPWAVQYIIILDLYIYVSGDEGGGGGMVLRVRGSLTHRNPNQA